MRLVDVYAVPDSPMLLYALLAEREPHVSISHRKMPTAEQHVEFMSSRPYAAWYLIEEANAFVGAVYLSRADEIGVSVFKKHQGHGYGPSAVRMLTQLHPRPRFLANINPRNEASIAMFARLGFTHIQDTYELRP